MKDLSLLEPMRIGPAIETMKILRHYVSDIKGETDPMTLVRILISKIQERQPSDSLRLVSLTHGIPAQELMDKVKGSREKGSVFYRLLVEGFTANPLPDLINAGYMLGNIDEGWTNAG